MDLNLLNKTEFLAAFQLTGIQEKKSELWQICIYAQILPFFKQNRIANQLSKFNGSTTYSPAKKSIAIKTSWHA